MGKLNTISSPHLVRVLCVQDNTSTLVPEILRAEEVEQVKEFF